MAGAIPSVTIAQIRKSGWLRTGRTWDSQLILTLTSEVTGTSSKSILNVGSEPKPLVTPGCRCGSLTRSMIDLKSDARVTQAVANVCGPSENRFTREPHDNPRIQEGIYIAVFQATPRDTPTHVPRLSQAVFYAEDQRRLDIIRSVDPVRILEL